MDISFLLLGVFISICIVLQAVGVNTNSWITNDYGEEFGILQYEDHPIWFEASTVMVLISFSTYCFALFFYFCFMFDIWRNGYWRQFRHVLYKIAFAPVLSNGLVLCSLYILKIKSGSGWMFGYSAWIFLSSLCFSPGIIITCVKSAKKFNQPYPRIPTNINQEKNMCLEYQQIQTDMSCRNKKGQPILDSAWTVDKSWFQLPLSQLIWCSVSASKK